MSRKLITLSAALLAVSFGVSAQEDTVAVFELDQTVISAGRTDVNRSPLRLTDIDRQRIRIEAPGRTFPELIRNVPGVYASSETGSYGDAKLNIRGFKQENISVLLNGIPISGLTSGSMYWNNWMGLSDATASIQIQKGIGNSMLSDNSVGGTVNILTTTPSEYFGADMGYSHTGYGTEKAYVNLTSGTLGRGWAFSLMGSYTWGTSYAECTGVSSWSYLAVLTKKLNPHHSLNFTALGSPETHEQRSSRLSYDEVARYGTSYSKNWGWYTDASGHRNARTLSRNEYFKPYFTLTHSYVGTAGAEGDIAVRLNTSAYAAVADGGGYYSESTGRRISSFITPDGNMGAGHIDWNAVYDYNRSVAPDAYGVRAQNLMSEYQAGHTQFGVKSDVLLELGQRWQLDAGLHYQLYKTWERERITDLLGADYWYEDYESQSLAGMAGRDPVKHVGDYIRTRNGRDQNYLTAYALGTYHAGERRNVIITVGTSVSGTLLRRWDTYNYVGEGVYSDWTGRVGASVKGGALFKVTRGLSLYVNGAAYSRAPYANVFFSGGGNAVSRDITNEKNYLGEAGLRLVGGTAGMEATFYAAYWKDKTLASASYKTLEEEPVKYLVSGLDAFHYGGEFDAFLTPCRIFRLDVFASIGDWRWKNDVEAIIYDPVTMQPVQQVNVYADGLHVGDAPQTQVGASALVTVPLGHAPSSELSFRADWNYNDRFWADFDPVTRTDISDRRDSYRIPGYHLLNANLSWSMRTGTFGTTLFCNLNNILDTEYVERSRDGASHDSSAFTGYWGAGRNINFGVRFSF